MFNIPHRCTNWAADPCQLTWIEAPWDEWKFLSYFKILKPLEFRQYDRDLFLKVILHTFYSPKPTRKDDIFAKVIQAIDWYRIKHGQKTVCDVRLFILVVAEQNFKLNLGEVKLKFSFFERYDNLFFSERNDSVVVLNVSDLFISDLCKYFLVSIWIHYN